MMPEAAGSGEAARSWWAPTLLIVLFLAALTPWAADFIHHHTDEFHYTEPASRMLSGADLLVPRYEDGAPRLRKPILPYWFVLAGYKIVGFDIFGARLFWLLSAAGILALTYIIARTAGLPRRSATFALALAAGNPILLQAAFTTTPDLPLAMFLTLAMLGLARALRSDTIDGGRDQVAAWLFWIGVGLGFMSKGSLALVFMAYSLILVCILDRASLRNLVSPLPILVSVLPVLGWYGYIHALFGDELWHQFVGDQVSDKITPDPWNPLYLFGIHIGWYVGGTLPWSIAAIIKAARRPGTRDARSGPIALLLLGWAAVMSILFAFAIWSSHLYFITAVPVLAIALAAWLPEPDRPFPSPTFRIVLMIWASVLLLACGVLAASLDAALGAPGEATVIGLGVLLAIFLLVHYRTSAYFAPAVAVLPLALVTALVFPIGRLVLPDIGRPLAEKLVASGVPASEALFVGHSRLATRIRMHVGTPLPFLQCKETRPEDLARMRLVMTVEPAVTDRLRKRGFRVETVIGGWRAIDVGKIIRHARAGTLPGALRDNGVRGYFAIRPPGIAGGNWLCG